MDSQQDSKPHSASKGSHEDFFFFFFFFLLFTKTYLFISRHPSTPCSTPGIVLDDAGTRALPSLFFFSLFFFFTPPSSFNTTAVENQTALKQIDVLFNIVVTSSQGPCASASVTTAGLLSLARRWLPLCWSLQWFITKKSGRRKERRGERKKKNKRDRKKSPLDYDWVTGTFDWQGLISLSPP